MLLLFNKRNPIDLYNKMIHTHVTVQRFNLCLDFNYIITLICIFKKTEQGRYFFFKKKKKSFKVSSTYCETLHVCKQIKMMNVEGRILMQCDCFLCTCQCDLQRSWRLLCLDAICVFFKDLQMQFSFIGILTIISISIGNILLYFIVDDDTNN